ncbi:MAG: class I SAM-dependent methyltransferase [Acidimicrobiales bacterium]
MTTEGNAAEPGWDEHADWWIDGFTGGVDPEYEEQIIPLALEELSGTGAVLDVGCGEGQIARALAATGCTVTGIDPTERNLEVARERGCGPTYVSAGADSIPFGDESFDAVVACLVFEHIDALDAAVSEVARVLRPGGRFAFFLNHPLLQTPGSGWIDDHIIDPPEQYWRIGPYLTETATMEEVEPGVHIRFVHRPLSRYVNCLAAHGLFVERMVEPSPPPGFLERAPEYALAHTVPRLLYLRAGRRR